MRHEFLVVSKVMIGRKQGDDGFRRLRSHAHQGIKNCRGGSFVRRLLKQKILRNTLSQRLIKATMLFGNYKQGAAWRDRQRNARASLIEERAAAEDRDKLLRPIVAGNVARH